MKYYFSLLLLLCSFYLASANSLHEAVYANNVSLLRKLLISAKRYELYEGIKTVSEDTEDATDDEIDPDEFAVVDLTTPFELAIELGNLECAKTFLTLPAFCIEYTAGSYAPLVSACIQGNSTIAKILIDAGANIHAMMNDPLDLPDNCLQLASSALRLSDEDVPSSELLSRQVNYVSIVDLLIKAGANPNKKKTVTGWSPYKDERSPLYYAGTGGHQKIVKTLLDHKAAIDDACIEQAKKYGHLDPKNVLVKATSVDHDALAEKLVSMLCYKYNDEAGPDLEMPTSTEST